jgi:hypothetical protein
VKNCPQPRKAHSCPPSLRRRLDTYVLVASAAGVSLISMASPCDAEVVYTPTHVVIGHGGTDLLYIDFNHDGIADLALQTFHNSCTSECLVNLNALPQGNEIVGRSFSNALASALHSGARIGPQAPFVAGSAFGCVMLNVFSFPSIGYRKLTGDWHDVKQRYLGVKFSIDGATHFGWVRLAVANRGHAITGLVTGYAYETIPDKPIAAGQTSDSGEVSISLPTATLTAPQLRRRTLGLLAMGASGLTMWRSMTAAPASD